MNDVVTPLFAKQRETDSSTHRAQIIAVTSGKGGVGKSNIATNLAISLARKNHRVCIVDADAGLANINILLGLKPEVTLEQFLNDEASIESIIIDGPDNLKIIPGASGIVELAQLSPFQQNKLLIGLQQLERRYDYLLIDTAAGVGDNVTRFVQSADSVLLVISPDPTSLTDAFAMTRVLKRQGFVGTLNVIVNMASDAKLADLVFRRFSAAVKRYLDVCVESFGYVSADPAVVEAVRSQVPVIVSDPASRASLCIERLTGKIQTLTRPENAESLADRIQRTQPQSAPQTQTQVHEGTPKPAASERRDPAAMTGDILNAINSHDHDQASLRGAIEPLINAYVNRFGEYPLDMREAQFRHLESPEISAADIREQFSRLESTHEKRFSSPLLGRDDAMFRLMNAIEGSDTDLLNVLSRVQHSYDAKFPIPVASTINSFVERIQKSTAGPDDVADVIESLRLIFREKFQQEYSIPDLALRKRLEAVVDDIVERENARQEALLMLTAELTQHSEIQRKLEQLRDYLDNH